mmetsp:Transcript_45881/g.109253  ORF Transcript_45881/g.109253 Transcript_45881/m.109253 type:complete len:758 (+) Transcript_45881:142-2415(+)
MGNRPPTCGKSCTSCAADCARPVNGFTDELEDDRPGGDPAGATFEETLEDLNSLDRNLMLFCATSNLAAVRWLLHLGAHWDVCDTNGTSCLHVACRAGVLAVVQELARHEHLLEATDVAGWTALHIAVLMGRSEVVVHLLKSGASPFARNTKGQLPSELCADSATQEVLQSFQAHCKATQSQTEAAVGGGGVSSSKTAAAAAVAWRPNGKDGARMQSAESDIVAARLQYEPFFVPRQPFLRSSHFKKDLQRIGVSVLDVQPGYGLSFLVASGVVRDYPVDLSSFLRRSKVNPTQVGSFLGEAFSLSHTIRLEYVNSVSLRDTGVVSAMVRAFNTMHLPDDLQKVDRLVHAVARIWWRQHEKLAKDKDASAQGDGGGGGGGLQSSGFATSTSADDGEVQQLHELIGLELKQYLSSADALHQMMFSTVLLHWYMHRDGSGFRRMMDFRSWKELNAGIEASASNVPDHVLQRIHSIVTSGFIRELAVAAPQGSRKETPQSQLRPSAGGEGGGGADAGGGLGKGTSQQQQLPSWTSLVQATAPLSTPPIEGWAQLVGGGFPHATNPTGAPTVSHKSISSIFSEVTDYSGLMQKSAFEAHLDRQAGKALRQASRGMSVDSVPAGRRDDWVWITCGCDLMFFATDPHSGSPYAFTDLKKLALFALRPQTKTVTLVGGGDAECRMPLAADSAGGALQSSAGGAPVPPITIVVLLPDGRWQELCLGKLELRVPKVSDLDAWSMTLARSASATGMPTGDMDPQPPP